MQHWAGHGWETVLLVWEDIFAEIDETALNFQNYQKTGFFSRSDVSLHINFCYVYIQIPLSFLSVNHVCKLYSSAIQTLGKVLPVSVCWKSGSY